jgi:hypothetical protein
MEDKRCPSKGVKPIVMKRKRKKVAMTRPSPSELMNSFLFGACCQRGVIFGCHRRHFILIYVLSNFIFGHVRTIYWCHVW